MEKDNYCEITYLCVFYYSGNDILNMSIQYINGVDWIEWVNVHIGYSLYFI